MPEKNYDPNDPYSSISSAQISNFGSATKTKTNNQTSSNLSEEKNKWTQLGISSDTWDKGVSNVNKQSVINNQTSSNLSEEKNKWAKHGISSKTWDKGVSNVDKGWGSENLGETGFVTSPELEKEKKKWAQFGITTETWDKGVANVFGGNLKDQSVTSDEGFTKETIITKEEEKYKEIAKKAKKWFKENGIKNFGLYKTERYGNITNREFLDLFDAASSLLELNPDWTMRDAANYLENSEWSMRKFNRGDLSVNPASQKIKDKKLEKGEEWHTFGSGLRGSFETSWVEGGLGTMTRDEYGKILDILSGKWDVGSPVWKLQQQLQDYIGAAGPKPTTGSLALFLLSMALPQPIGMMFNTGVQADQTRKGKAHALSDDDPKASMADWALNPIGGLMEKYGWNLPDEGISSIDSYNGLLKLNSPLTKIGKDAYWLSTMQSYDDNDDNFNLTASNNYNVNIESEDELNVDEDETNTTVDLENEIPLWWDLSIYEQFIKGMFK